MKFIALLFLITCFTTAYAAQAAGNRMVKFYQAAGYVSGLNDSNKALLGRCGALFPKLKTRATQSRRKWVSRNRAYIRKSEIIINDSIAMMKKKKGSKQSSEYAAKLDRISAARRQQLIERLDKSVPEKQRKICTSVIQLSDSGKLDIKARGRKFSAVLDTY